MDTPGLQPRLLSLWLWEPRLSLPPSLSSCPLSKPAPTTPKAQLVISKEKRNWYPTTLPVFLPAFLFSKKECQKQTLYPQGTSRFLSSSLAIWKHLFCVFVFITCSLLPQSTCSSLCSSGYLPTNQAFVFVFLYLFRALDWEYSSPREHSAHLSEMSLVLQSFLFCLQNESGNISGSPYSLLGYLSTGSIKHMQLSWL